MISAACPVALVVGVKPQDQTFVIEGRRRPEEAAVSASSDGAGNWA